MNACRLSDSRSVGGINVGICGGYQELLFIRILRGSIERDGIVDIHHVEIVHTGEWCHKERGIIGYENT